MKVPAIPGPPSAAGPDSGAGFHANAVRDQTGLFLLDLLLESVCFETPEQFLQRASN